MVLVNLSLKIIYAYPLRVGLPERVSALAGRDCRWSCGRESTPITTAHLMAASRLLLRSVLRTASWATGSPVSSVTIASLEFIILEMLTQMLVVMLRRMVTSRAQNWNFKFQPSKAGS